MSKTGIKQRLTDVFIYSQEPTKKLLSTQKLRSQQTLFHN